MPSQLYQDLLDIEVGTLEALPIESRSTTPCYPYPNLKPTGRRQMMSLRTIVLENDLIRVTVCLDLGGRILYILDKRTGIEILPKMTALDLIEGGSRGAWLPEGIQWMAEREARANALGPVEFLMIEPEEDDQPATLILHELIAGVGISLQVTLELPPDSATIMVAYQLNSRNILGWYANVQPGLRLPGSLATAWLNSETAGFYDPQRDAGVNIEFELPDICAIDELGVELLIRNQPQDAKAVGKRDCNKWVYSITPFSGLGGFSKVGIGVIGFVKPGQLTLLSEADFVGKIFILDKLGNTLEADVTVKANIPVPLGLPPDAGIPQSILVRDEQKVTLWECTHIEQAYSMTPYDQVTSSADLISLQFVEAPDTIPSRRFLQRRSGGSRAIFYTVEGMLRLGRGEFAQAAQCFEDSLLYNGSDPLAWYSLALAKRLAGDEGENTALLNAHFLAPLEPLLRAEGFLCQPMSMEKDGSPLVAPIANHPEALIEVACFLMEAGLRTDAARWIDEALRHGKVANLLYLQAFLLTHGKNLMTEAAQVIQEAEKLPVEPPYPWRKTELTALRHLIKCFPDSDRLKRVLEIATT